MSKTIIAPTIIQAKTASILLGHSDALLLTPGAAIGGRVLNDIIMVGWRPGDGGSELLQAMGEAWFNEQVITHLPPQRHDVVYIPSIEVIRT